MADNKIRKKILCFGDSNTYGYNPHNKQRFTVNERWTKLVQTILNNRADSDYQYEVIEEGRNGRSLFIPSDVKDNQPALLEFPIIYNKYSPVDYVVICLGTNDLRSDFNLDTNTIAFGVDKLIKLIYRLDFTRNTKIILICPPRLSDNFELIKAFHFDKSSTVKSYDLPLLYKEVANMNNCFYFDAGTVANVSKIDGVHLTNADHENVAREIVSIIDKNETKSFVDKKGFGSNYDGK